MSSTFSGNNFFSSQRLQVIHHNSRSAICRFLINFNGAGGVWTLQDSLTSTSTLNLLYGSLITNNTNLSLSVHSVRNITSTRSLTWSSIFTLTKEGPTIFYANFNNFKTLNARNINLRFTYNNGVTGFILQPLLPVLPF